jgi:hypothetical protein
MLNKTKIIVFVLMLAAALLFLSNALAQTGNINVEKLYGSWNVVVMTVNHTTADGGHTFPALLTFGDEGNVMADEPPGPGETSGHGNWINNDDGTVSYTFIALFSGDEGAYAGKLKVVGTLQYDSAADTWQGPFKIDIFDADDKVVAGDTGTFDMARMAVESLD